MAKEQKPAVEQPGTQEPPQPTQRERYASRRKEAYPDISEDDEDAYYGQANADLDELEGYRKSNQELADVFDKTPTLAGMLLAAKEGENPFVYLAEQAGPDLDIRTLINDPDFGQKITAALDKYQENQLKGQQAQEEMKGNYQASFAALKEIQQERGMSDEECLQLVDDFFENVVGNASKGIVSKETWEAYLKAHRPLTVASRTRRRTSTMPACLPPSRQVEPEPVSHQAGRRAASLTIGSVRKECNSRRDTATYRTE